METFQSIQWLLLAVVVLAVLRFVRTNDPESGFKPRRDRDPEQARARAEHQDNKKKARLLLEGVVLVGLPHQILGVREDASEFEIRKAHRNLIKRFHPDKVGEQGSRTWYEAQRASEAINGARDEMLAALARRSNGGGT